MKAVLRKYNATRLQICHNKVKPVYEFRKIFAGSGFESIFLPDALFVFPHMILFQKNFVVKLIFTV